MESRIRKLSVHLTRLTEEDIDKIRRRIKRKAEKKLNRDPIAKKTRKKSSNFLSLKASASIANCAAESSEDDTPLIGWCQQKLAKTKNKKKPSTSSASLLEKQSKNLVISSPEPYSKEVFIDAHTSSWDFSPKTTRKNESKKKTSKYKSVTWNDNHRSYSTSEESELEEVFVPSKIWIKPSARPMSATLPQADAAHKSQTRENPCRIECSNTSRFSIRQPIVLIKKMNPELDTKYNICDGEVPSTSRLQTRNLPNTSCCLRWQEPFQRCASGAHTMSLPHGSMLERVEQNRPSESEEFANKEHLQDLVTANHVPRVIAEPTLSLTNEEACYSATSAEKFPLSRESADLETIGHSSSHCCNQSLAIPPLEKIISVVPTNELEEASTQNILTTFGNVSVPERNQSDNTVFSPVIFDEEPPATQDFGCEVLSPIIFGSNEGTAADSCDVASRSNDQSQEVANNTHNSSSGFILEVSADEHSETAVTCQNCDGELISDASRNFNLQLSEDISPQDIPSGANSQEFNSSSSFALEIPPECPNEDFSDSRYSQQSSINDDVLSSRTEQGNMSAVGAPSLLEKEESSLSVKEIPNLSVNPKINLSAAKGLDCSGSQQVYFSMLKDKSSPCKSKKIWLSSVKPQNFSRNQKVFLCSVRSPSPTECKKIFSPVKVPGLTVSEKSNLSAAKAPSISGSQGSYLCSSETPNSLGIQKSDTSSVEGANLKGEKIAFLSSKYTNAFTQTDPQAVCLQSSEVSVNCIINGSGLEKIRFEGRVVNHPSTIATTSEKISASDSSCTTDMHHCPGVLSSDQTTSIPCNCNMRDFAHHKKVASSPKLDSQLENPPAASSSAITKLPPACSDSILDSRFTQNRPQRDDHHQFLASKNVIDSIDLTGEDEPMPAESALGKIRLKTPSELGCTIAFMDDVERLFRYELRGLHCDLQKLDFLKKKYFNIFKLVLAKFFLGKTVDDTLLDLYRTRGVPCGSNLLRDSPPAGFSSVQMLTESSVSQNSTRSKLFYGHNGFPKGFSNCTHDSVLVSGSLCDPMLVGELANSNANTCRKNSFR